ncbi:MAG TPA: DUF4431 domain-containing protein [Gallionellaceae bacterium]
MLFTAHASATETGCLAYEPAETAITGKLVRLVFPGPPNFESIALGDEAEIHFYLVPAQPICTDGDASSATHYPQHDVNLVQLVLRRGQYQALKASLGRKVTLIGSLFAAHTAHHHAPLLLDLATKSTLGH